LQRDWGTVRRLAWILTLPVTLVVVVFAIANRQLVAINLWPLEETVTYPLFIVTLGALVSGFLLGAVIMWLSESRLRDRARRLRFEKEDLERELGYLQRHKAQAEDPASGPGPSTTAARPGLPATASR